MIRKKVKSYIKAHKKIDYLQKCIRRINNESFVQEVLDIGENPFILKVESLGTLNRDKVILLIENVSAGFFGEHRRVLDALAFADRFGFIPVVAFNDKYLYFNSEPVNGEKNPFQYYFKQVSNITVDEALSSYNVIRFRECHRKLAEQLNNTSESDTYIVNNNYLKYMSRIEKKYIQLNPIIENKINNEKQSLLQGKRTLGVHAHTGVFKNKLDNHPVAAETIEHIEKAKMAIKDYGYEQIFLATDEEATVELFKNEFGDKVVWYDDVFRTSKERELDFIAYGTADRKNHKYLLGYEVLRDMITLSECQGFVAGLSMVAFCTQIRKYSLGQEYEYIYIIDKGIQKNNSPSKKYNEQQKKNKW